MKKTVLLWCLLLVVTAGFSYASDYSVVQDFVKNGFLQMDKPREEVIRLLGKPKHIKKEKPSKAPGEAYMCAIYWVEYEGLELTFLEGKKCSYHGLQSISITSNKYKVKHNIGVGSSKEQVIRVLGKPVDSQDNKVFYPYDKEDVDLVGNKAIFYFDSNNRVSKIEWGDH